MGTFIPFTGPDDFDVWNLRNDPGLGPIQLASWPWTDDMTEFAKTTPYTYDEVTEDFELILVEPRHRQENYIFIVTESIFNDNRPDRPFDGMTRDVSVEARLKEMMVRFVAISASQWASIYMMKSQTVQFHVSMLNTDANTGPMT